MMFILWDLQVYFISYSIGFEIKKQCNEISLYCFLGVGDKTAK